LLFQPVQNFNTSSGRIMDEMRIDKWLWAARFFKTRSAAQEEVSLGRVLVDGSRAKPSRSIRPGNLLEIRRGEEVFKVYVEGLSNTRGPAAVAQKLYRETQESKTMREARAAAAKIAFEPSVVRKGRPTKKEGRELRRFKDSL
jgi:ribosome-associated heat shock protein Hsp15